MLNGCLRPVPFQLNTSTVLQAVSPTGQQAARNEPASFTSTSHWFAVGVLLTLTGLIVLGGVLRAAGARVATDLGQAAFAFGGALWLASLAFRATATFSAARETVASGAVPSWFEPLRAWSGALFAIYMVLAYLAIAAYGRALLQTRLVPRWLARAHLIFGLAGALGFVVRLPVFAPPLMIHLPLGLLGLVLLEAQLKRPRRAFAESSGESRSRESGQGLTG
jgi:hypothetical protein